MARVIDHDTQQARNAPAEAEAEALQKLAWLLDSSIPIPGTRMRVGIDALIGLIPGLGDLIGVFLSGYIVREAWRLGAPKSVLMRMAFNVAVEGVVGAIPFFGDLFDAAWKANQRNVRLLQTHYADPRKSTRANQLFLVSLAFAFVLLLALMTAIGAAVWALLRQSFGG
ncbi:MAG TPA: DUF4112 domain-containing protein [Burkholderiales bacterium]|nr:DUF4112 domain-containing protein [Burkholderiales bacterium]